ncbi:MAG: hypothetical protein AAGG54_16915 [Pseudomonadota bacterium]
MMDQEPNRLLSISVAPTAEANLEKILAYLRYLAEEEPTLDFEAKRAAGCVIIGSNEEAQLEIVIERLKRACDAEAVIGAPEVALLETISKEVEHTYTHRVRSAGSSQFADLTMIIAPTGPGGGCSFESRIVGSAVPTEYIGGIEKGVQSVMASGPLGGAALIDIKVVLTDAKFRQPESSALAFEIAARTAFREGILKAGAKIMEPIMKVDVVMRGAYISDLNSRRGKVLGQNKRGGSIGIDAVVPLVNMLGYAASLHRMSSAGAHFSMQFDHYAVLPSNDDPDGNFAPAIGLRA